MCARQHKVAEVACYRLKGTLMGCTGPLSLRALLGCTDPLEEEGRCAPSVSSSSQKNEVDESSLLKDVQMFQITQQLLRLRDECSQAAGRQLVCNHGAPADEKRQVGARVVQNHRRLQECDESSECAHVSINGMKVEHELERRRW